MIALPLAVASWLGAHCLAYWLVAPAGEHQMGIHAESGHAYLGYTPAILVWGLALVVAGLLLCVGYGLRGSRPSPPPLRLFALVPPVGFTLQEHLERLIGTGGVPPDIVLEPTFLVGLALQLPLTLAALLLAHALNSAGFTLGAMLAPKLAPGWPHLVTPRLASTPSCRGHADRSARARARARTPRPSLGRLLVGTEFAAT